MKGSGRKAFGGAGCVGVLVIAPLLLAPAALAQRETRQIERTIRRLDDSYQTKVDPSLALTERSMFDVGGFLSFTTVWLTDSEDNARTLIQPEITVYGRAVIDGAHTFFGRARGQYRDYSEGDSFDGRGDRWREPVLDRYWYEFDYASARVAATGDEPDWNLNVRLGRQFVDWYGGLTLSENLYAARPVLSFGQLSFEGMFGVTPPDESIIDFDASRDDFDTKTERGFFGGAVRWRTRDAQQFYAYALHMPDYNSGDDPRAPLGIEVDFDYEATYVGVGATGSFTNQFTYLAEFVYQFGESKSDPFRVLPQTTEDISAYAARGQLAYLLRGPNRSRLEFEVLAASGDDDRFISTDTVGGNEPGTDDNGFNSLGFANTGLAFAPSLSNVLIFRVGGSTFPIPDQRLFRDLQVGVDVLLQNKLDADAPIDEPTDDEHFLGAETDFYLNWRLTSDVALTARYGLFFPGDAIDSNRIRQFIFGGVTISF